MAEPETAKSSIQTCHWPFHEPAPSPRPLPLRGGEGARRAGEGRFMVPMHTKNERGLSMNRGGARIPRRALTSYPLEIRARRSLAPPFMVPMRSQFGIGGFPCGLRRSAFSVIDTGDIEIVELCAVPAAANPDHTGPERRVLNFRNLLVVDQHADDFGGKFQPDPVPLVG